MTSELESCPFCGSNDIGIWEDEEGYNGYYVYCECCGKMTDYCDTPKEAVDIWNRR